MVTVSLILFIRTSMVISKYVSRSQSKTRWSLASIAKKMELAEILGLIEHFEHHTKFGEADKESNCEDE